MSARIVSATKTTGLPSFVTKAITRRSSSSLITGIRANGLTVGKATSPTPFSSLSSLSTRWVLPTTSFRHFSTAKDTLVDLLNREHAEEIENGNNQISDELKTIQGTVEKAGWKIVDPGSDAVTRMYKTSGTTKIQIAFHCQDTIDAEIDNFDEDEESPQPIENNEGEDEYNNPVAVKFTVTVTKGGTTIIGTCLSEDAALKIQSIAVSNVEDVDTIIKEGGTVPLEQYQGPEFDALPEDVQEAFYVYFEEDVGINTDVATFISLYSDYKELNQYANFLKSTISVLK